MSTSQQGPTPEFAVAYRDTMLMGLTNELQATKKVLAAIPDAKRDYKPDPNARTARELAWHLASADVQMLDETADRKFVMDHVSNTNPQLLPNSLPGTRKIFFAQSSGYAPCQRKSCSRRWTFTALLRYPSFSISDSSTITASTIAEPWLPTSVRWAQSAPRFTEEATTCRGREHRRKQPLDRFRSNWKAASRAAFLLLIPKRQLTSAPQ